jgi:fucose permease
VLSGVGVCTALLTRVFMPYPAHTALMKILSVCGIVLLALATKKQSPVPPAAMFCCGTAAAYIWLLTFFDHTLAIERAFVRNGWTCE